MPFPPGASRLVVARFKDALHPTLWGFGRRPALHGLMRNLTRSTVPGWLSW